MFEFIVIALVLAVIIPQGIDCNRKLARMRKRK